VISNGQRYLDAGMHIDLFDAANGYLRLMSPATGNVLKN